MAEDSKIEWTDHTFNPWEGCQEAGPGCKNCYAELRNARFSGGQAINFGPGAPRRRTSVSTWSLPRRWNAQAEAFQAQHGRRQRVFCASLADVFDNAVDPQWRAELFALIQATPNLDWLLLTKRIGNVEKQLDEAIHHIEALPDWGDEGPHRLSAARDMMANWVLLRKPPKNIWLGATICNQEEATRDIPKLLAVPARVRFLSMEPLLGPVDLERPRPGPDLDQGGGRMICQPWLIQSGIDWVIVGGESGPNARPMHPGWARSLRDQCNAADVAFLFKQWGEWGPTWTAAHAHLGAPPDPAGESSIAGTEIVTGKYQDGSLHKKLWPVVKVGKKAAGRLLDGRTWDEFPAQTND